MNILSSITDKYLLSFFRHLHTNEIMPVLSGLYLYRGRPIWHKYQPQILLMHKCTLFGSWSTAKSHEKSYLEVFINFLERSTHFIKD
jgi:hypothetical protein